MQSTGDVGDKLTDPYSVSPLDLKRSRKDSSSQHRLPIFLDFGLFCFHITLEYSVLRGHVADVPVITGMVPMSSFIITRNSPSPKETATMRVLYSQSPP
jgi:hypothetical protein